MPISCGPGLRSQTFYSSNGTKTGELSETSRPGWGPVEICVHDDSGIVAGGGEFGFAGKPGPGGQFGQLGGPAGQPKIRTGFQELSRTRTGSDPLPGIGLNEIAQMFAFQRLAKETGGDDLAKFFSTLDPTSGPSLDRPGTTSDLLALPGAKTGEGITTGGFLFGDVPDVLRNFNRTIFNTLPGGTVERRVPGRVTRAAPQLPPVPPNVNNDFPGPWPQGPFSPGSPPIPSNVTNQPTPARQQTVRDWRRRMQLGLPPLPT